MIERSQDAQDEDAMTELLAKLIQQVRREPLALFALLAAFASAYYGREQVQVNLPRVSFERLTGLGGPVDFVEGSHETGRVDVEMLHVLNTGGRPVTLVALEGAAPPAILEAVLEEGSPKLRATDAYTIEVATIKENVPRDLMKMLESARKLTYNKLELPYVMDDSIESGKARVIALAFRARGKDGKLIADAPIVFSCKARFSDGSVFDVYANFSGGP